MADAYMSICLFCEIIDEKLSLHMLFPLSKLWGVNKESAQNEEIKDEMKGIF